MTALEKHVLGQTGCCLMIALLGILVYGNHLNNPFQFDSVAYVANNQKLAHPEDLLSLSFLMENYFDRGLLQMSLAVNAVLGELHPFGYHLFNLTFHIFNAMLTLFITEKLCRAFGLFRAGWSPQAIRTASLFTAVLFLCHPLQTESVVYIMSRSEVLAATFYLGSFFLFQVLLDKEHPPAGVFKFLWAPVLILAAFILGFSVKQTLITLPAALLLYGLCQSGPKSPALRFIQRWRWLLGGIFFILLAVLFRKLLTDETFLIGPSNPEEMVGRRNYMLSQPAVIILYYLRLLLFPFNLSIDPDIPVVTSPLSLRFLLPAGLILSSLYISAKADASRIALFCILWFLIILSPSSSIVTLHDLAAEHRVYLAAWGFYLILSLGLLKIVRSLGREKTVNPAPAALLLIFLTVFLGTATAQRNLSWRSEQALWEDTRNKSPRLVRPLINLGRAYTLAGQPDRAIHFYERSLKKAPGVFVANYNLGELYFAQGRVDDALKLLLRAERLDPGIPEVHGKLGEIYLNTGQYELADRYFKKAVELNPKYAVALRNLGILNYFHLNRPREGVLYFSRSLTLDPNQPEADKIRQLITPESSHGIPGEILTEKTGQDRSS